MTNPQWQTAHARYTALTSLTKDEDQILRSLGEIDLTRIKATKEELAVIEKAKKIRDSKSAVDLPPQARINLQRNDDVEAQIASAPERYRSRSTVALNRLNESSSFGKRFNIPNEKQFARAFSKNEAAITRDEKIAYSRLEKLFTEHPNNLSHESKDWLRTEETAAHQQ